jgi:hypothetical protein
LTLATKCFEKSKRRFFNAGVSTSSTSKTPNDVEDAQRRLFSSYDFEKLFQAVYSQVASEVFPTFLRTPKLKQAAGDLEAILRAHGLEEFMSKFRKRGVTDIRQLQQEDYTDSQLYRNKYKIDKIGIQKRLCRIVNKELHLLAILLSEES